MGNRLNSGGGDERGGDERKKNEKEKDVKMEYLKEVYMKWSRSWFTEDNCVWLENIGGWVVWGAPRMVAALDLGEKIEHAYARMILLRNNTFGHVTNVFLLLFGWIKKKKKKEEKKKKEGGKEGDSKNEQGKGGDGGGDGREDVKEDAGEIEEMV